MNDEPRQALRKLVAKYGPDLCGDAKRCEGLLRDLCGEHRREINILVGALRERVPLDLLAAQRGMPRELLLTRLAKRLEDQLALTEDAAMWAVDSWALALGVVTVAEVEERQKRPTDSVAQPAAKKSQDDAAKSQDDDASEKSSEPTETDAPVIPAPSRQKRWTPPTQTPAAGPPQRPPQSPPPARAAPPPPPARGPVVIFRRRWSSGQPPSMTQPSITLNAGSQPDPRQGSAVGRRGGRWRGCFVGCLLVVLLSLLVFVVAPFVVSVLREEQMQRDTEFPPSLSQ